MVPVVVTEKGLLPALTVAGVAGDKTPVVALMVYTETLLEFEFATYANWPEGSIVTEIGLFPAATAVPREVKAPVAALMEYMDTVPSPIFVA